MSDLKMARWDQPDWIEQYDAVAAAPEFHKVVFEDDAMRLLAIVIAPGQEEPVHTHKWKSILWFSAYSPAVYTDYSIDENDNLVKGESREIRQLEMNKSISLPPEGAHTVKNTGNDMLVLYRLEFKQ